MVRLRSIGFLLQVGRCYVEDHGAWQERLSTHACWSTFVSERCGSRVTCISLECIILCYVIGRSARTRSKKSCLQTLCSSPPTCPSRLTLLYISSDKGVFCTILSRSISTALQVNLVVSLRLSPNPRYPAPLLLPLTMCERYLWPTQYIFINEFWFFKGPYERIQVPLYFVIDFILNNDFCRPVP